MHLLVFIASYAVNVNLRRLPQSQSANDQNRFPFKLYHFFGSEVDDESSPSHTCSVAPGIVSSATAKALRLQPQAQRKLHQGSPLNSSVCRMCAPSAAGRCVSRSPRDPGIYHIATVVASCVIERHPDSQCTLVFMPGANKLALVPWLPLYLYVHLL